MKGEAKNLSRRTKLSSYSKAYGKCVAPQGYRYQSCLNGSQGCFLLYPLPVRKQVVGAIAERRLIIVAFVDVAMSFVSRRDLCQQTFGFSIETQKLYSHSSRSKPVCRAVYISPNDNTPNLKRLLYAGKLQYQLQSFIERSRLITSNQHPALIEMNRSTVADQIIV